MRAADSRVVRVEIVAVAGPGIFAGCSGEARLQGIQVDVAAENPRMRFKLDEDRSEPALEQRADAQDERQTNRSVLLRRDPRTNPFSIVPVQERHQQQRHSQ